MWILFPPILFSHSIYQSWNVSFMRAEASSAFFQTQLQQYIFIEYIDDEVTE